jgi:CRP-like cAMP-binding protein
MQRPEFFTVAKFALFAGIAPDDLDDLLSRSRTLRIAKNGQVFAEGSEARSFFVLVNGFIRATKTTVDGNEITVRYVSPGEIFGVAAAIGLTHYPATATAVVDATMLCWPSAQWQSLAEKYPALATNALRAIGGRLQDAHSRVIELTNEEVERRIARTLLRLAAQAGRRIDGGIEIEIPLRRQDVAQLAGTTMHSASRVLSSWEQNGFVHSGHQRIILYNSSVLGTIAEGTDPGAAKFRSGQ